MTQLVRLFRRAGCSGWWLLVSLAACQTNRAAFQLQRASPSVAYNSDEPISQAQTTDSARPVLGSSVVQQPANPAAPRPRQPGRQPYATAILRRRTSLLQPLQIKESTRPWKKTPIRNRQQPADALDGLGRLLVLIGVGCLLLFAVGLASGSTALAIISGLLLLLFAIMMFGVLGD